MIKGLKRFVFVAIILIFVQRVGSLEIGSCEKLTIDGEKCLKCIDNYHLEEGECYLNILGCKGYNFGNICHECQNGYILVNNLCCDERCMAKILKRHKSIKISEVLSSHFKILALLIPKINTKLIKGELSNLVEIQYERYQDVDRYVFLFEFYSGGFSRKRAIVDYQRSSEKIIIVDWKTLKPNEDLLMLEWEDVQVQRYPSFLKAKLKNQPDHQYLVRKINFVFIQQYEIVDQNQDIAIIEILYEHQSHLVYLSRSERPTSNRFQPYELIYTSKEQINARQESSPLFSKVMTMVRKQKGFHDLQKVKEVAHSNKLINFVVVTQNDEEIVEFYVEHLPMTKKTLITDTRRQRKEKKPKVETENHVEISNQPSVKYNEFQLKILEQIRLHISNTDDFQFIEVWVKQFKSFSEVTILSRQNKIFQYFHLIKTETRFLYLGSRIVDHPSVNKLGKYVIPNPEHPDRNKKTPIVEYILSMKPLIIKSSIKVVKRQFPLGNRYTVNLRFDHSKVQYIVRELNNEWQIVEESVLEQIAESQTAQIVQLDQVNDIVQEVAIEKVLVQEEEDLSQEKGAEDDQTLRQFIKSILNTKFKIIRVWRRQYRTFKEITVLVRVEKKYYYLYVGKDIATKQFTFWGKEQIVKPLQNQENQEYIEPNEETQKDSSLYHKAIQIIHRKHPQTLNQNVKSVHVRKYPTKTRITIFIRLQTSIMRFIVIQKQHGYTLLESDVVETGLKELTPKVVTEEGIVKTIVEDLKKDRIEELTTEDVDCTKQLCKTKTKIEQKNEQLIEVIKSNNQFLQTYTILKVWNRKPFKTHVQITILMKTQDSYYYFFIQKLLPSNQLIYWGSQKMSHPILSSVKEEYAIANAEQAISNQQLPRQILSEINKQFPETIQRNMIVIHQRKFPENRNRYQIIIRLISSKKRFIVHEFTDKITIVESEVTEADLPIRESKEDLKKQKCAIQTLVKIVKQQKEEEDPEQCQESDSDETDNIKNDEESMLEQIRNHLKIDQTYRIIRVWRRKPFTTFREITVLIEANHQYYYFFFLQNFNTKTLNFAGYIERQTVRSNGKGRYLLPNAQKRQNLKTNPKINDVESLIKQSHPDLSTLKLTNSMVRVFPLHIRYYGIVNVKNIHSHYVIHLVEGKLSIIEFEYDKTQRSKPQIQQEKIRQSTKQIIQTIITQKIKQEVEEIRVQTKDDIKKEDQPERLVEIEKEAQYTNQYLQFTKRTIKDFSRQARVIQTWKREPFKTFTQITILIRDSNERYVYAYLKENEDKSLKLWGFKEATPKINPSNGEYSLLNPQHQIPSSQVSSVMKKINEEYPKTTGMTVISVMARNFPLLTRYNIRIRRQTAIERYLVVDQNQNLSILQQEIIQQNLQKLTVQEIQQTSIISEIIQEVIKTNQEVLVEDTPTYVMPENAPQFISQDEEIVEIIRKNNPKISTLEVIKIWRSTKFTTFVQITILIRSEVTYHYFYIKKTIKEGKKSYVYLGHHSQKQPTLNQDKEYVVPNLQVNAHKADVKPMIDKINQKYPEMVGKTIKKILIKRFTTCVRVIIIYRLKSRTQRFVVTEYDGEVVIEENGLYQMDLEDLEQERTQEIQIIQNVEADMDMQRLEVSNEINQIQATPGEDNHLIPSQQEDRMTKTMQQEGLITIKDQIIKIWKSQQMCKLIEYTVLIQLNKRYVFYFFSLDTKNNFKMLGFTNTKLRSPINPLDIALPNQGKNLMKKSTIDEIKTYLHQQYPNTKQTNILSSTIRQFPLMDRVLVNVRLENQIDQFVLFKEGSHISTAQFCRIEKATNINKIETIPQNHGLPKTQEKVVIHQQKNSEVQVTHQTVEVTHHTVQETPNTHQTVEVTHHTVQETPNTHQTVEVTHHTVQETPDTHQTVEVTHHTVQETHQRVQEAPFIPIPVVEVEETKSELKIETTIDLIENAVGEILESYYQETQTTISVKETIQEEVIVESKIQTSFLQEEGEKVLNRFEKPKQTPKNSPKQQKQKEKNDETQNFETIPSDIIPKDQIIENLGEIKTIVSEVKQDGEVYYLEQITTSQISEEQTKILTFISSKEQLGQYRVISVQEHISEVGIDFVITIKQLNKKTVRFFVFMTSSTGQRYYLGKEQIEKVNRQETVIIEEQDVTNQPTTDYKTSSLKLVVDKQGNQYQGKDIQKITYRAYPSGYKITTYFNKQDRQFGKAHLLQDYRKNEILIHYTELTNERISSIPIHISQVTPKTTQNRSRPTLNDVLSYLKTEQPECLALELKKDIIHELPHKTSFQLTFESSGKPTKKCQIVVSQRNLQGPLELYISSIQTTTETQEQVKAIDQIVHELEQKDIKKYVPLDPSIINYAKLTQLWAEIELSDFEEILPNDQKDVSEDLKQGILYVRSNYQIIRKQSIVRIVRGERTNRKSNYKIYFYVSQNNDKYQVYEAHLEINKEVSQIKVEVISFRMVIEDGKIVKKGAEAESNTTVDIAYGYIKMSETNIRTNSDLKVIDEQIKLKYKQILKDAQIQSVEYLELKDGRVNFKVTYSEISRNKKYKFVTFYHPKFKRVLILNSLDSYSNKQITQLSTAQQKTDPYLHQILNYLMAIHPKQMTNYTMSCTGKLQMQSNLQYQIEIEEAETHTHYRSIVQVVTDSEFKEISWIEVVSISLDHYRLDEFQRLFIVNYQKLSTDQLAHDESFKIVNSYAKHQNSALNSAQLLGAANKPFNLGFLYRIYYKSMTGQILKGDFYIQSYTSKVSVVNEIQKLDFTSNFVTFKQNDESVTKIVEVLKRKVNFDEYVVKKVEGKDFLFGNLFRLMIDVMQNGNQVEYEGLIYHDHSKEEVHLIYWRRISITEAENCQVYDEANKNDCKKCQDRFSLINNICTKDCGALCLPYWQ